MSSPTAFPESEPTPLVEQDRRWRRRKSALWAAILDCGGARYKCLVLNISRSGAMLQLVAPLTPPQAVTVTIEGRGAIRGEIVWRLPDKIGVQFAEEAEYIAAVLGDMTA